MYKKVIKRSGEIVDFNKVKIKEAICKAMYDSGLVDEALAENIAEKIEAMGNNSITIEEIQDLVEGKLMCSARKDVAKEYIRYRYKQAEDRYKRNNLDNRISELVDMKGDYINANANKDAKVFNTKRDLLAGIVAKDYAIRKLLPPMVAASHENNLIYWHDMDYSPFFNMYNCMLIDFEGMLKNGFTVGNADIESPKSIETACAIVPQIVANVSSLIYGGTSFNRADEVLAPYAKLSYEKHIETAKEFISDNYKLLEYAKKQTIKSIENGIQSLEYEINSIYNSNGQVPFFTIGFGLGEDWFAVEIQKAILKQRIKGLGKSRKTAIFPKLVFALKEGLNLNKDDKNYEVKLLALKCASKRMYPDIVSYKKLVEITGDFKFPMGCRSYLGSYMEDGKYITDGRNNLGVVTLNIPRIALDSKGDIKEFWKLLNDRLLICKEALLYRIYTLNDVVGKNAPILYMYGATGKRLGAEDKVADIFKNGRASISLGYIGLYEAGAYFYGGDWEGNKEAKEFTLEILKTLKAAADKWKGETGYGFSIYSTPAESLTHTFCNKDKEVYGEVENITDKGYYTNSFH